MRYEISNGAYQKFSAQEQQKLLLLAQSIDMAKADAEAVKQSEKDKEQATRDRAKAQEEANRILYDLDPMLKLQAEWEKLVLLKEQGLLTDEQIGKAYAKTFDDISKAGDDSFKSLENAVRGWGSSFTDEMTKMVRTGKMDFASLADSIINDLIRIQIQKNITDKLVNVGTSFLDSFNLGSLLGGGSTTAPASTGATASSWTSSMPMLPSFAVGTDYVPYDMVAQIHKGERIVPAAFNPVAGGRSASSGTVINLTNAPVINIDSRTDQAQVRQLVQSAVQQGNAQLVDKLHRQGVL